MIFCVDVEDDFGCLSSVLLYEKVSLISGFWHIDIIFNLTNLIISKLFALAYSNENSFKLGVLR